ncbi:enoyl-CoA hydratase/isomerase family protein [Corynebacterium pilosum]|uniref:3-hydroxyisobutyryl-CoA hydrolase n=1 Tax=Corynebacterium pilosum TaxID=35756 RepID=A0A376CMS5_9CORY|nr:enoyl-CoA hydratase/isomerase family protein [Corynebacterium pilosum]STC69801.1 enoyl-CoA hydratase [Corynebacterium pilosum]
MSTHTEEIQVERRGKAGLITLNRSKALNALNHSMVQQMTQALEQFEQDDSVALVIVKAAGDRAFCAGGDIAVLYEDALKKGTEGAEFWADEYRLNVIIANYSKPYVPLMQGIVLGGGVGISAHGSHRVVTDSTRIGMPETGIGYFPDVGGTKLLAEAPRNLGKHLALTARQVGGTEAIAAGLADYFVPDSAVENLVEKLAETGSVDVISEFTESPAEAFNGVIDQMEQAYAPENVQEILENLDALQADGAEWAADAAKRIRRNCPLTLTVVLEAFRRHNGVELGKVLENEFVMSAERVKLFVCGA